MKLLLKLFVRVHRKLSSRLSNLVFGKNVTMWFVRRFCFDDYQVVLNFSGVVGARMRWLSISTGIFQGATRQCTKCMEAIAQLPLWGIGTKLWGIMPDNNVKQPQVWSLANYVSIIEPTLIRKFTINHWAVNKLYHDLNSPTEVNAKQTTTIGIFWQEYIRIWFCYFSLKYNLYYFLY